MPVLQPGRKAPRRPGRRLLRKSIALPTDHGSWVFLLGPLVVGLVAGGRPSLDSAALVAAALCGFLVRQPITIAIKAASGRRSRDDLRAALFWTFVYAISALGPLAILVRHGYAWVLTLALPGMAIFGWYLRLVSARQERRQVGMEVLATGVLALVAPAALWVGRGRAEPVGWLLWLLLWAHSASSIVYVYLRLEQRGWREERSLGDRLRAALPSLTFTTANTLAVLVLGVVGWVPLMLLLAYAIQLGECVRGAVRPASGHRPVAIGKRQLAVSTLFVLAFATTWSFGPRF